MIAIVIKDKCKFPEIANGGVLRIDVNSHALNINPVRQ